MKTFAVIDIGSNSVRLMFVADGKVLYKRVNTTRLGEGIAARPILKTEAIERSAQAVADFYEQAKEAGAEKIFAFATAAVRSAENGSVFVKRVDELCGLRVEVVSGEEEAELGVLGALGGDDGGVIDVGGASTEIVIKSSGKILYRKSIDVGVVRLKDGCGREEDKLRSASNVAAIAYGSLPFVDNVYAIGGTATTLAALKKKLSEYDSKQITGTAITIEEMQQFAQTLLGMKIEEIAALPCMPKGRADVLAGGAVLLFTLMKRFGWKKLIVSDQDNLEGYAIKKGLM